MDGQIIIVGDQFEVNQRGQSVRAPAHPPVLEGPFSRSPKPTTCTPDDPFGRGQNAASFEAASPHSKTEREVKLAAERSAAEFGEAINGPVFKAAEWLTPGGKKVEALVKGAKALKTLIKDGPMAAATDLALGKLVKSGAGRVADKAKLPQGSAKLIEKAGKDAIKKAGGAATSADPPAKKERPGIEDRWDRPRFERRERQEDIQRGVDRSEHRQRVDPGTMIA